MPKWTATEELRIGSLDDSATMLTAVGAMVVGPDGRMYVDQAMDGDIRVFDAGGKPLRTIGRKGKGPGEFQSVYGLGLLHDTLYTVDYGLNRESLFSLDGDLLGSFSLSVQGLVRPYVASPPWKLATDGTAIVRPGFLLGGPTGTPALILLRVDRQGAILDTLLEVSRPDMYIKVSRGILGQPFLDAPATAASDDALRLAVVDRRVAGDAGKASFRVTVMRSSKDTVYSRSYDYTPVPMPAQVVDSVIGRMAGSGLKNLYGGDSAATWKAIHDAVFIPKYALPVSSALFSADGDLWLRREDLPGPDHRWMVLDTLGNPVGTLTLPHAVDVRFVRGDELWGTTTDSLDIPYVVRYKILR